MHTHKLIRLIRARPMLYNFEMEDYNNKIVAERKWMEIAQEMNATVSECKTKWNSLRTAYNTYLNKLKRHKKPRTKWIHADEMCFLKQFLKRNRYGYINQPAALLAKEEESSQDPETAAATAAQAQAATAEQRNLLFKLAHVPGYGFGSAFESLDLSKTHFQQQPDADHVDVETCDDYDDDEDDSYSSSMMALGHPQHQPAQAPFHQDLSGRPAKMAAKIAKTEPGDSSDAEEPLNLNQHNHSNGAASGEKTKKITLEAPESLLISFETKPKRKKPPCSEDVFGEFVAMKLKTFAIPNRLEIMSKIWAILSEASLRDCSTHNNV